MPRASLAAWKTEHLRLTVFARDVAGVDAPTWWKGITSTEPETVTSKASLGFHSVEGTFKQYRLVLSVAPNRIDWLFTPKPADELALPDLGAFDSNEAMFFDCMSSWISRTKLGVNRIAFGSALRLPVQSTRHGYETLGDFLPAVKIDPGHSSDFLYQINRPRGSKVVDGLKINRLSNWAVISVKLIEVISQAKGPGDSFCRTTVDISTDVESDKDLFSDSPKLIKELCALGREIVERGDVP
jgi:hypothetical protein